MRRILALLATLAFLFSTAADAARQKGRPSATAAPPADPYKACAVRVRDYLRGGGALVVVKEIKIDDTKLQMEVIHMYGSAGKGSMNFLRGDTEKEKFQHLQYIKNEMRVAAKAAQERSAWYLIASKKIFPPDPNAPAPEKKAEKDSPWLGIVLADIGNTCKRITLFETIDPDTLHPDLQNMLKE